MRLNDIIKRLPSEPGKPALVSGVLVEREQMLTSVRGDAILVILTDRTLPLNGGNGHNGVDGLDMGNISYAVRGALGENRRSGFVSKFVVRERRFYPPGNYDTILSRTKPELLAERACPSLPLLAYALGTTLAPLG